jgi:membrane protein implicated in regulation of membrane protease activity
MTEAMMWWSAAGLLVLAELATGTFYLLMLAVGLAAAALAAQAGLSMTGQFLVAAAAGSLGVGAVRLMRGRRPAPEPAASNRDVNLDIGQHVHVEHWNEDGTARVQYRGAGWQVRFQEAGSGQALPSPGTYVIRAMDGNELVVGR